MTSSVRVWSPIAKALEAPMAGNLLHVMSHRVRPSWVDVVLRVLVVVSMVEGVGMHDNVIGGMALVTW
jgi:hypothetical protein